MNKELYKKKFDEAQTVKEVSEHKIIFESGIVLEIEDYHSQDCCEHVYADWSDAKYVMGHLKGKKIDSLAIKGISGEGFLICFNENWDTGAKVFIPCYNVQNGYYSSELKLTIHDAETKTEIDISEFLEDKID